MTGLFGSLFRASADTPAVASDADDSWYRGGYGPRSATGRVVTPDTAMQVAAVFSCVNLLARTLAMLPLTIRKWELNGDTTNAPQNPLWGVLHSRPNDWQTSYDFRAIMMGHLCLRCNAYAEIRPGRRGAVDKLIPLHPDRVTVRRNSEGTLTYNISELNGRTRTLVADEVFHIRGLSSDGVLGISPITQMREAVGLALATEEHGARLFSNGARPGGVLKLAGKLSPQAKRDLKSDWEEMQGGLGNSHRVAVLTEGLEWEQIGLSNEDSQFIASRTFQIEEIARIFQVPLFMLGVTEKSTTWGSGIEQLLIGFVIYTLMPWIVAWEQAITRDLIVAPEAYFPKFNLNALLRGDSAQRATFYKTMVGLHAMTPNEVREREDMNKIAGGDEFPPVAGAAEDKPAGPGHNGGPPMEDDADPAEE